MPWRSDHSVRLNIKSTTIPYQILEQMRATDALRPDSLIPDWDRTVFADLVRLMQRHGGRVVVFNVPLTSWHRLTDRPTPEKMQSFHRWARQHDVLVLNVPADYPDEAFPDLVHLADAYAPDFTRKLAEGYQEAADVTRARSAL